MFIKEDGHLIFYNQLFDSRKNKSMKGGRDNLKILIASFSKILSNIIGLSRTLVFDTTTLWGDNVQILKQNSVLKIEISDKLYNLEKISIISNNISDEIPVISERREGKTEIVRYKYTMVEGNGKIVLEICGVSKGNITIKFQFVTKPSGNNLRSSDTFESLKITKHMRVQVFENICIPSIELQEVIFIMESSFSMQRDELLSEAAAIKTKVCSFISFIRYFIL